jgi:hypothetical protein
MSTLVEGITPGNRCVTPPTFLDAALLTGGCDRPYAYGLAMALISKNIRLDVIGSEVVDSPEMHTTPNLQFLNLWPRGSRNQKLVGKAWRTLRHYVSLIRYAAAAQPGVFHILWNSKVEFFDRTLLMLYYKMLGKKITLTVHNVNKAKRDSTTYLFIHKR